MRTPTALLNAMSLFWLLALLLPLAACSPQLEAVLFFNRADAAIAIGPGLSVAPCSSLHITAATMRDAQRAASDAADRGEEWMPEGAFEWNWDFRGFGKGGTWSIIVSGVEPTRFVEGEVTAAELPPCGGRPMLE